MQLALQVCYLIWGWGIEPNGSLNEKSLGVEAQAAHLREEVRTIELSKGKKAAQAKRLRKVFAEAVARSSKLDSCRNFRPKAFQNAQNLMENRKFKQFLSWIWR